MRAGWKQPASVDKLRRLPDGSIAGVLGDPSDALAYIKWLSDGVGDRPKLGESTVILMLRDRTIQVHESNYWHPVAGEFCAWGSGSPAANAAMYMGADARKAIEIAALLDDATGGDIVSMRCEG